MIKKRQQYSATFKAKVALEAIREDSTLAQLSSKYQINANVISKWKKQALENLDSLFSGKHDSEKWTLLVGQNSSLVKDKFVCSSCC